MDETRQARPILYWLPGEKGVDDAIRRRWGLDYALSEAALETREVEKGPDGGPGIVIAAWPRWSADDTRCGVTAGYWPDRQTWWKCGQQGAGEGARHWWLGVENQWRPGPDDLERGQQSDWRYLTPLGDGNQWMVAVAAAMSGPSLPRNYGLSPDGGLVATTRVEYRDFELEARALYDRFTSTGKTGMSPEAGTRLAAQALGVNYRVGWYECMALELFGSESLGIVLLQIIDWPTYQHEQSRERGQKKTD